MAKIGDVWDVQGFTAIHPDGTQSHYWFVIPKGMTREHAYRTQEIHGPFDSEEEAMEDQRVVLLGDQCEVTDGEPQ